MLRKNRPVFNPRLFKRLITPGEPIPRDCARAGAGKAIFPAPGGWCVYRRRIFMQLIKIISGYKPGKRINVDTERRASNEDAIDSVFDVPCLKFASSLPTAPR